MIVCMEWKSSKFCYQSMQNRDDLTWDQLDVSVQFCISKAYTQTWNFRRGNLHIYGNNVKFGTSPYFAVTICDWWNVSVQNILDHRIIKMEKPSKTVKGQLLTEKQNLH